MNKIVSVICGLITTFLCLSWANSLIHLICNGITDESLRTVIIIVLWLISLSAIIGFSIFAGMLVGALINAIISAFAKK
jgi:hypothetical protein